MSSSVVVLPLDTHGTEIKAELIRRWNELENEVNVFRYKLNVTDSKVIGDRYKYLVQCNSDRTTKRRQPQQILSLLPTFDVDAFNFNKINPQEILLHVIFGNNNSSDVTFLVNNSPLTRFHTLICPDIRKNQPQILSLDAITFSVRLLQTFGDTKFKIGYNSPGAFASVNHLHMHLIHLDNKLFIEDVEIVHLRKNLYRIAADCPASGYCFFIEDFVKSDEICCDLMVLVEFFLRNHIPHNLLVTYDKREGIEAAKIFVFPRKEMCSAKEFSTFNIAFCELSGYVPVGSSQVFAIIDDISIANKIKETIGGAVEQTLNEVISLYEA